LSPFPLPAGGVVKIREVSSAMSLKHLPAVLARSLYCPKRAVPSSGKSGEHGSVSFRKVVR